MMNGLDPVELVRERADIVEVIGESVVLKRAGRNYLGLCPFHGEKTPSFNVNPEKRMFRCFGCQEGGDVFAFVMKLNNLGFRDALKQLAERYGVPLESAPDPNRDQRNQLRAANEEAARFFQAMLAHPEVGREARAYLEGRGVDAELAQRFMLGYAPREWDALHKHLKGKGIPASIQEEAGLVRARRESDGHYDYFRGRIIFPITGELNQVIAFGGRAFHPGDEPKYLNSPDTLLYHKGRHLYALAQAKDGIKAQDRVLLMEGYMDAISAHRAGFTEAVGVLGTALTAPQAKSLLRYSKRVLVCYDADKAGVAATERGIATLEEVAGAAQLDVRVLRVPSGKDPDEFLRTHPPEAFAALLEQAQTLLEYQLDTAILKVEDRRTPEGKAAAVQAVKAVMRRVGSKVLRDEWYTRLARRLDVSRDALALEIDREFRHNGAPRRISSSLATRRFEFRRVEEELLKLMVEHNAVRQDVKTDLAGIPFSEEDCQRLRERIEAWPEDKELTWDALLREYPGEQEQRFIARLALAPTPEAGPDARDLAASTLPLVAIHFWDREHELYQGLFEEAIRAGAPHDEIDALMRQFNLALERKEELKSRCGSKLPTKEVR